MIIPTKQGLPAPDLGSWEKHLTEAIQAPKMCDLATHLSWKAEGGTTIYPPADDIFAALQLTDIDAVKVVILGQDPYHGPGQAHGLAFSVQKGQDIPPSLRNIYQELLSDLGIETPEHGNLKKWANQGVLLLNTLLTVEESKPLAHKGKGWEDFTDAVISAVSKHSPPTVFILWGNPARKKAALIDSSRHHIIESVHPSPLSASRGFFGSRPFSRTNAWLKNQDRDPVDWTP